MDVISLLNSFWNSYGVNSCERMTHFPYGACTFDMLTIDYVFDKSSKPICFHGMCYRPFDLVMNDKVIRVSNYVQYQVLFRSGIYDSLDLVRSSIDYVFGKRYNCYFITDNWSAPTMGAYGYGWEGRILGLECVQITHFTNFGGHDVTSNNVLEIVYGVERMDMLMCCYDTVRCNSDYCVDSYFDSVKKFSLMSNGDLLDCMMALLTVYDCGAADKGAMDIYFDFLELNLVFNILDSRAFFSEPVKNMYMYKISKVFKFFITLYKCV